MQNKGFSLLEVLITLIIFIFFVTLTLPKFDIINRFILQNEIDKLFTTFSYLQQKAIAANQNQYLFFDIANKSYNYLNKKYKLPEKINFGTSLNVLWPPSKPRNNINNPITFKKFKDNIYRVDFYADGNISSGVVFLINNKNKNLMALSCPVSPFSCIRKYKYENNRWVLF